MIENFSWLRALNEVRHDPSKVHSVRTALKCQSLQGFELELLGRWLSEMTSNNEFNKLKVAVISGHAAQPLANAIRVAALAEGISAQVYEAPFGAIRTEIFGEKSGLYEFEPNLVLLDVGTSALEHFPSCPMPDVDLVERIDNDVASMQKLWHTLAERLDVPVIQHTLVMPAEVYTGFAERGVSWSVGSYINALNTRLISAAPTFVCWLDLDTLSKLVGLANWHDPRLMHHAKFGFATKYLPDYAAWFGATLRGILARAPKALILDLDNTLWGGVIGDDGLDGIRLGPDTADGAAYQDFCNYVQSLGERGVTLGICSKNDLSNVREVFANHPHMPLSLESFAVVRCNWDNKADNLKEIATELNIDLSAIVFVDDNPAECELIRQQHADVRVVQMDGDPAAFVRRLDRLSLFHSQSLSKEDLNRTNSYRARAQSVELISNSNNLDHYLKSLEMKGKIERVAESHLLRIAQMEMKTNQFNLSTRRLSQNELLQMCTSADHLVIAVSLADRFADHGLVAYIAGVFEGEAFRITDWLMSCRVFSRTLEKFTVAHLAVEVKTFGVKRITFSFIPSNKNSVMLKMVESVGFVCEGNFPIGPWCLSLPGSLRETSYIAQTNLELG